MELQIVSGPEQERLFSLVDGEMLLIGRADQSDIQLQDPRVSRKHCLIKMEDQAITVTDCDSSSGTFINGRKIASHTLRPGDLLQIGATEMRLRSSSDVSNEQTLPPPKSKHKIASTTISDDLNNLVGRTFHKFAIESEIAQGRTGKVFLASHTETGEKLALKILWPSVSENKDAMLRFVRAMKTMRPIRHPNIVRILNAGIVSGNYCWVSMERVKGDNLTNLIKRVGISGMLDWQTSFRVALHIGRALEAAAEKQIVHRNITPNNILIQSKDKVAKLGDLMLAKAFDGIAEDQISATGELVGDLSYMSPEATFGTTNLDARSDLYSLGAAVYSLMTGRPVFESSSMVKLIDLIRNEKPEPPNRHGLAKNDQFERIVMKMLEKRPEDRQQSPSHLVKELELLAELQGITV